MLTPLQTQDTFPQQADIKTGMGLLQGSFWAEAAGAQGGCKVVTSHI